MTFLLNQVVLWWFAFTPVLLFISLLFFKKTNSIKVSGNILAVICYTTLLPSMLQTGGVYSDFNAWLFIIPLTTVLVEDLKASIFWLVITITSIVGIYLWGTIHTEINSFTSNPIYHVLSLSLAGIYMFCMLAIFEGAQVFTINILKNKNALLNEQKETIAQHAEELEMIEKKLIETNKDLQNFAFAASHDLKEPLRMIGMYTQLIQRRLGINQDDNIKEYMHYVTDGVKRMQKLLEDLLSYSRLGKNESDTKELNLNDIFVVVKSNLTVLISETNAHLKSDNLPNLLASATEMTQLFQNLISNSIKFRKPNVSPIIEINYMDNGVEHLFSVSDNGIGIKKEHMAKVFDIFTRLHSQAEYEGTGIGLATCKKIILNFGGRIWLESTEGVGTTFYFTIPKVQAKQIPRLESKRNSDINIAA